MIELSFEERIGELPPLRLRSFAGRNIEQMPLLLTGTDIEGKVVDVKRRPMTPKELLSERLHNSHERDRELLKGSYVDTSAVAVDDPNGSGELIVGLYNTSAVRELVHSLGPNNTLEKGLLPVAVDVYQAIKAEGAFVFDPTVASDLRTGHYAAQETRERFWEHVAEGDAQLVKDTLESVQQATEGGDLSNRMGIWFSKKPGMRLLSLTSVDASASSSAADFGDTLTNPKGRLIGIATK